MKKIINPYASKEGYNCFGCCQTNPIGLKMEFFENDDEVICTWSPSKNFQGYFNILHGGIQAALMDEIASWVVFSKLKTSGFTIGLNAKYRKQVELQNHPLTLRAKLSGVKRMIAEIDVKLYDSKKTLCSEATAKYYIYDAQKAKDLRLYTETEPPKAI